MITAHHLVFGRKYGGIAYWLVNTNISNPTSVFFGISTKNGNIEIDWKDGTPKTTYITSKNIDSTLSANNSSNVSLLSSHSFPANFIASVELNCLGGLNDVYSLYFGGSGMVINQDFGSFINQFPSLYSINIDIPHSVAYLNGDVSQIPNSVEKVYIRDLRNSGNLYLNISNFNINSQLKEFKSIDGQYNHNGFTNIYGDLSKLPPLIKIFTLKDNLANTFTYTSGKTWASSFDTLDLGNAKLSATETDNLLIDMANSITTAIGSKIIRLANCYRTTASNTAVAYLQGLGFTITVAGIGMKVLDLPLQNNFTDTTGKNTMVAGGASNLPTFTLEGGEYAATFNGSQSLKTNSNFVIGTDKVSISFWIKTSQTVLGNILELSNNFNNNNAFSSFINDLVANNIAIYDHNSAGNNYGTSAININDNTWRHIVLIIDRSKVGSQQNSIYINGILSYVQSTPNQVDLNGNFGLFPLFIGQRAGNSSGYIGQMKFLKIFNYPLSPSEITNLYNKTM